MSLSGASPASAEMTANRKMLEAAVEAADLRVLLMVVFHLSGDRSWLDYRPSRDVKLIADEDAGLPEDQQQAIRAAAVALLSKGGAPAITDPGDVLMTQMMTACLGEAVAPEYAPLMREELGLIPRDVAWRSTTSPPAEPLKVVIVGAGVSGIALAARLQRLAIDYVILERNSDVGGVWLENRYPGAGVDTPSHAYSYSFGRPHPWPHFFSSRDEIHQYLRQRAAEFDVRPRVRFNTRVTEATWDEKARRWSIGLETPDGPDRLETNILVSAIGQFGAPEEPRIEGADRFEGAIFHSARWPDGLDVTGRRVAVIGTGASAMQIVPTIAERVASLDVYQRTAQWARPVARYHDPIDDAAQWLMQNVPFYAGWFRFTMWWRYGDGLLQQLHRDPKWPHPERSINRRNDRHRQEMSAHIRTVLHGRPDLIAKSIPSYPPFAKRILLDNGWYAAISRPNVDLVVDRVARLTAGGVVTADGAERPADVIVLATGFQLNPLAARLNITGRHGLRLIDAWGQDNPTAYLGITAPGFPNFFMMGGPNTGLAHGGSAVFQAESQARYISGMVVELSEAGLSVCEVRQEAHDAFVERVDAAHETLIWTHPGVSNYYKNSAGRIFSAMPFRLVDYWRMTHAADLSPYLAS